jgi:hypothetical protein
MELMHLTQIIEGGEITVGRVMISMVSYMERISSPAE